MISWIQRLFRNRDLDQQLDAELRFHVEQQTADHVAAGMSPREARRRALIDLGGSSKRNKSAETYIGRITSKVSTVTFVSPSAASKKIVGSRLLLSSRWRSGSDRPR